MCLETFPDVLNGFIFSPDGPLNVARPGAYSMSMLTTAYVCVNSGISLGMGPAN